MPDKDRYDLIRAYKASIDVPAELARYGAHSMGIGRKIVGGEVTDTIALRLYVAKKRPLSELTPFEEIPKTISFLPDNKKVRRRFDVDVIESPMARFEQIDPEANIRPVPGGVSCGIPGSTGTIGGWVWDTTDDTIVMLSNDHVFLHTAGTDIIQRGSADGGSSPADKIGDVKRGIPRVTSILNVVPNIVDCSIGDPDSSDIYDLSVLEIGPAVYAIEAPSEGLMVEKFGQTTEHTFGEITDNDWEGMTVGNYYFEDCFRVDARAPSADWSDHGDSGSLVFSQTPIAENPDIKPVVGLHFAGAGTYGLVCKIQNVFDQLDLTTLCDGAFGAVLDSLFNIEVHPHEEAEMEALTSLAARAADRFNPQTFVRKTRKKLGVWRPYYGISRDVQKRLQTSKKGRLVADFFDQHRAELLTLFAKDGDVRRATLAAIRPLVAGAETTTDVMERVVTHEDLKRLNKAGRELMRKASPRLKETLEQLKALEPEAGVTLGSALGIET